MAKENGELWRKIEEKEIVSLLLNKTWTSVQTPPEEITMKSLSLSNGFTRSNGMQLAESSGIRRVSGAKGYKQKHGVDFEEVFNAPVSRHVTVRALLAVAVVDYLEVKQLDVKTAFLNGELEEETWADQPKGSEVGVLTRS